MLSTSKIKWEIASLMVAASLRDQPGFIGRFVVNIGSEKALLETYHKLKPQGARTRLADELVFVAETLLRSWTCRGSVNPETSRSLATLATRQGPSRSGAAAATDQSCVPVSGPRCLRTNLETRRIRSGASTGLATNSVHPDAIAS